MSYVNLTRGAKNPALRYLQDLWNYRSLCFNLVGSDLRSRFRRSRLGLVWAIIQPLAFSLMIAAIWATVFNAGFLAYGIYVFSGMIVWEFFSNTVSTSQDSLVQSEGYIKQERIPFIIFQLRTPLAGLVTFIAGGVGLAGLLFVTDHLPEYGSHLLYIPLFIPLIVYFLIPIAIIFSILGTQYRDLKHAMSIILNGLFFLSPIMIAREFLYTPQLSFMKFANPMLPLLELLRAPILNNSAWEIQPTITILVWSTVLWIIALTVSASFGRRIIFAL